MSRKNPNKSAFIREAALEKCQLLEANQKLIDWGYSVVRWHFNEDKTRTAIEMNCPFTDRDKISVFQHVVSRAIFKAECEVDSMPEKEIERRAAELSCKYWQRITVKKKTR